MLQDANIFDRRLLRKRRDRSAKLLDDQDNLITTTALELIDRLGLIKRDFPLALNLGSHGGLLETLLKGPGQKPLVGALITSDLSFKMIAKAPGLQIVADEETLPFGRQTFDLVTSLLGLHLVNDLPGALTQIRQALKPDGLFLGALFGGETLKELRNAFVQAELEIDGGASPRIAPSIDVQSMGQLLQRAGFALPVIDIERLVITHESPFDLFRLLRQTAQSNILIERKKSPLRRKTLNRACELYAAQYSDPDGRIKATFEVIFALGWAPHDSQQKPLRPGSAKVKLAEALNTKEQSAGEKALPRAEFKGRPKDKS